MPSAQLRAMRMHYVLLDPTRWATPRADIVLVHGLAANLAFWYWRIAPALATFHRVLLVDLRGHGLSSMPRVGYTPQAMADDLKEQLDRLGMGPVHLLGHSFGGRVVIQFANSYPNRVRSVTLADVLLKPLQGSAVASAGGLWPTYRGLLATEGIQMDERTDEPSVALLEALARLRLKLDGSSSAQQAFVAGPFGGNAGRRSAIQWLRLLEQTSARQDIPNHHGLTSERLATLRLPVLLVYGEYSPAIPSAHALQKLLPHATLDVVPGAGHFFPITRPDRLLQPVHGFLTRAESQHQ